MKNKCIVDIPTSLYNKLIFISNKMGITINELLSQIINDKTFTDTINIWYKAMLQNELQEEIKDSAAKQR